MADVDVGLHVSHQRDWVHAHLHHWLMAVDDSHELGVTSGQRFEVAEMSGVVQVGAEGGELVLNME